MRASWDNLFVFLLAGLGALTGTSAYRPGLDRSVEMQIDALMLTVSKPSDPGFAVLVKQGPKVIFLKGYGVREFGQSAKIESNVNFRLASVTKQFTAMAVMLLVRDGRLRYEDHLTDIWPDFPAYGSTITVRELLTHTSGLPDYENLMETEEKAHGPKWSAEKQITDREVLDLLKAQTSGVFPPGTKWEYSNSGYVVLGLIVTKVSGESYGEFLQKRIFAPSGMKNTVVYEKGKNQVVDRAYGHTKQGETFPVTDQSSTSATLGDGGIYSNVEDLANWDDGLTHRTLLSREELSLAWTAATMADGSPYLWPNGKNDGPPHAVAYGFGWFLDPYKGHPREYHDGESIGFRSTIERYPKDNLTIIILSNRTDISPRDLGEKIADILFAAAHGSWVASRV